jgi:small subunit ribosomal protein S17
MASQVRNVGIPGVEPPKTVCSDKKCPWHGDVRVRGLILRGTVIKTKMQRTAVVEREYLYYDKKYKRYEKRRSRIHAHNPPCINAQPGDEVIIGETRPLAKTVHFVIVGVVKRRTEGS